MNKQSRVYDFTDFDEEDIDTDNPISTHATTTPIYVRNEDLILAPWLPPKQGRQQCTLGQEPRKENSVHNKKAMGTNKWSYLGRKYGRGDFTLIADRCRSPVNENNLMKHFKEKLLLLLPQNIDDQEEFKRIRVTQEVCPVAPQYSSSLYRCDYGNTVPHKSLQMERRYHINLQKFLKIKEKLRKKNSSVVTQVKEEIIKGYDHSPTKRQPREDTVIVTQADREKARQRIKFRSKDSLMSMREKIQKPFCLIDSIPDLYKGGKQTTRKFHTSAAHRLKEREQNNFNRTTVRDWADFVDKSNR